MAALAIIAAVIVLAAAFVIGLYNGMVKGRNLVEEAWSGVSIQLKRRHDLVPNLVSTVQGYAAHERGVYEAVTQARAASLGASGVQGVAEAETGPPAALGRLAAAAEAHPQLQADANRPRLQDNLAALEDELQMARRYYNGTARDQNNRIQQFPGNIFASAFGFRKVEYFELDSEAEKAAPKVSF
ncbi:MAG: LemA family protein [Mailhella sp.]|nr:LemA family protein [Mailhella sp.]